MRVFESMIGWLAPPICVSCGDEGTSLCSVCSEVEILPFGSKCWHCGKASKEAISCDRARRAGSPKYVWITTDYELTAKELLKVYKYNHLRKAARPIAKAMAGTFLEYNSDKTIRFKDYLIVPVPTASGRARQRSFDHTALLAYELSFILKLEMAKPLGRLGQTRQVGARRGDRLKQLRDKLYITNPAKVSGRNILLIDDVITTGGTMIAASKALRKAGAKSVSVLAFSKKL